MGLTPAFKILANSRDITDKIQTRLLGLTVADNAGLDSDTVDISLDDADHALALTDPGAELEIHLGYQESGIEKMGLYTVDEIELSGPPSTINISAKAANMRQSFKAPKTRTWQKPGKAPARIPLVDILETIASEHQLTPKLGTDLQGVTYEVVNQTDESDLNLVTRLAKDLGAVAKPAGGNLLFVKQGMAKNASGATIPPITLSPGDITHWTVTIAERGSFHSVQAKYVDRNKAETITVTVGEGDPAFIVRASYKDEEEATIAAEAKLDAFTRGKAKVELTLPGNPAVMAEAELTLKGFRDGVNGSWIVETVEHRFSNQGYVTTITGVSKS